MRIIHEYPVKVFENTFDGKKFYKIGLAKKDKDGKYTYGSVDCHFRKDVEVDASKKIYLQDCWLDFYVKDKKTYPYIFVNKFDYVADVVKEEVKDPFVEFGEEVELTDDDLPF